MPRCRSTSTSSAARTRCPRSASSAAKSCRISPMPRTDDSRADDHPLARIYAAPGHLIRRCQQIAVAIFVDEASAFDLTPVQYAALFVIRALPGVDHTRLVNLIALDRSTIGSVVARLVAKGLIRRKAGTADKRTKRLFPTPAGAAVLEAVQGAV